MRTMLILLIFVLAVSACTPAPAPVPAETAAPATLREVNMPVGYIPNVQFAPLYVAMEKGYFKENGINLTLDYSFETDAVALVGANKLQFAVVSGEQVPLGRSQGLPLVYVAAWYQQYPVGITSMKESGIEKPADLKGRKIGVPVLFGASYVGMSALLHAGEIAAKDVTIDTIGYNQVEALVTGSEDAVVTYVANEPVQLAAKGYETTTIKSSDYMKLVSNGMITNEATIQSDPALVKAMVTSLLRGMRDTIADPDQAFEISTRYVENLAEQKDIQKQVLLASIELWKTEQLGHSDPEAWQNMQDLLLEIRFLAKPLDDLTKSYSNDFIALDK